MSAGEHLRGTQTDTERLAGGGHRPDSGRESQPWDEFYRRVTAPAPCIDELIRRLLPCDDKAVLDLGCGTGRNLFPLVAAGLRVSAIDISAEALELASEAAQLAGGAWIGQMSMDCLAFPAATFDGVVSISVLNHGTTAQVNEAFAEVRRVLKPGGWLLVTMISTDHPTYGKGVEIEPDVFVTDAGVDAGVPHRFFTVMGFHRYLVASGLEVTDIRPAGIREIGGVNDGHIMAVARVREA